MTIKFTKNIQGNSIVKLLLNIRINLSFNKIQLLLKQQFLNYFVKKLNPKTRQYNFFVYFLRPLLKNMGNMQSSLANYNAHILTC